MPMPARPALVRNALGLCLLLAPAGCAALPSPASHPQASPARPVDFAAWWQRQAEREAEARARDAPQEQRRALTRDQVEFWESRRERQGRVPRSPF